MKKVIYLTNKEKHHILGTIFSLRFSVLSHRVIGHIGEQFGVKSF